jgi:hypothetical protein
VLPLILGDSARALGKVILKVQEAIEETFELVELAYVYVIGELVE